MADFVVEETVVADAVAAHADKGMSGVVGLRIRRNHVLTGKTFLGGLLAETDAAVVTRRRCDVISGWATGTGYCQEGCEYYELQENYFIITCKYHMMRSNNYVFCLVEVIDDSKMLHKQKEICSKKGSGQIILNY